METQVGVSPHALTIDPKPTDYVMAVQAGCYRVDDNTFATESAFAEHVRMLKRRLSPHFDRIYLAAPEYSKDDYVKNGAGFGHVKEAEEGIYFVPLDHVGQSAWKFWTRDAARVFRSMRKLTRHARVLHGALAYDVLRPSMFLAQLAGLLNGCKTLFFADIDFRKSAWRFKKTGVWSLKSYLACSLVYDPLRVAQLRLAARTCSLVLLKSAEMVRDFGKGRPNVKNFWDTAHSEDQLIDEATLAEKLQRLDDTSKPISLVYFGRLVPYKGIDRSIRAVELARRTSGRPFVLDLIGTGDEKPKLQALVRELGAEEFIRFHDPLPYGPELFERIRRADLLLATPLTEDTPRSAFDAMASAVPILAFDIAYYRCLAEQSGAVVTSPWTDIEAFAEQLVALDADRPRLRHMSRAALSFARDNTQEIWLDRRIRWTLELLRESERPALTRRSLEFGPPSSAALP